MSIEIKVGQLWQEVDPRAKELDLREVTEISEPYRLQCRNRKVVEARTITFHNIYTGRKSLAKTHTTAGIERFNGKRGGYKLVKDVE